VEMAGPSQPNHCGKAGACATQTFDLDDNMEHGSIPVTENKSTKNPASAPSDPEKQGCVTSFLTGKRNEMDKLCGGNQATTPEEYAQPDEEKETGGES
jgi:hypothetical protein